MVKLYCVDFDGTLVDSFSLYFDVYKEIAKQASFAPSMEEFISLWGTSLDKVIDTLQQYHRIDISYKSLIKMYNQEVADRYIKLNVFDEAISFLEEAKESGIRLALVSSTYRKWIDVFLKKKKLDHLFDYIVDPSVCKNKKPHPEPYQHALLYAQVLPQDALAFEDSLIGVRSAQAAGINTVFIVNSYGSQADSLIASLPSKPFYAGTWEEVIPYVQGSISAKKA